MPRITVCPRCTSHLGLPGDVSPAAQVQCPICEVEFSLATIAPRELPQARVVEPVAVDAEAAAPAPSAQERLAQLIRATAAGGADSETAAPATEAETESYDDAYQDADPQLDDPQLAAPQPPQAGLQLGGSRLDQLLSELIKSPAATGPAFEPTPATMVEHAEAEAESPLATSFDAELDGDELVGGNREEAEQHAEAPEFGEQEEVVVPSLNETLSGEAAPQDLRTAPRRKRRPAGARMLVGIVGGGVMGILLGAYGLLWLRGAEGDFLGLAKYLPPAMLPASVAQVADDDAASVEEPSQTPAPDAEPDSMLASGQQPPMHVDPAVAPATAEEPVASADSAGSLANVVPSPPEGAAPMPAEPAAEGAVWPTTPIVGDLRGVKLYSVDELAELIPAADAAHREFLAGDLSREESWSTMGPAYMTLASLAERYTLTDPKAHGNELVTKQIAAKNIFRGAVGDAARRADLATVAARWLQHERRLNQGVLLIGRVRDLRPQGKWTEYAIDVPLGEDVVRARVLMDEVRYSAGDEVAVVGAIVPRPLEQLAGYQGDRAQVVVAGYAFAPEEFVAPQSGSISGAAPFGGDAGGQ